MNFAGEALTVLPTIIYRGLIPATELATHGSIAALAAAGGLALWNGAPSATRLATAAIVAVSARTIQSLYWSTLPHNVMPGDESSVAAATMVIAAIALLVVMRSARASR
jgi:hypothetical protein